MQGKLTHCVLSAYVRAREPTPMIHTDMQTSDSRGIGAESYSDPRLQNRSGRELRARWGEIETALDTLNRHSAVRRRRSLELMHMTPTTLSTGEAFALAPQFELSPLYPQRLDPSTVMRFRRTFWSLQLGDTQPRCDQSQTTRTPVIAITWQASERGFGYGTHPQSEHFDLCSGQLDRRPKMSGYESAELIESGDIWTLQQIGRNEVVAELKRFIRLYRSFLDRLVHIDER